MEWYWLPEYAPKLVSGRKSSFSFAARMVCFIGLLFKVPTKIARVRDPSYLKNAAKLFNLENPYQAKQAAE